MLVPGLMRDFRAQIDPAVQFQLHSESGFSTDLLKAVEEGRLDLAFTSHPGDPAQFESFAFHQTRKIRTYFRLEKGSDFSFSSGTTMKAPLFEEFLCGFHELF